MRWVWSLLSIVIFFVLLYLGFQSIIAIGWVFGWTIAAIVGLLIVFEILDGVIGWSTIIAVIVILFILELTIW